MHTPRLVGSPGQEPHFGTVLDGSHAKRNTQHATSSGVDNVARIRHEASTAEGMEKDIRPRTMKLRNNEPWDGTHDPEFLMLEW